MKWLGVFTAMFVLDFVYAKYTLAVQALKPTSAASYAFGITLCNVIVTIGFVHDNWLVIPTLAGAYAGTYFAVRHSSE